MANFCPNCGSTLTDTTANYCPYCGAQINAAQTTASYSDNGDLTNVLGTLVTVSLVGGLTRQLYYYGGRYFIDPYCRHPYGFPHRILHYHPV
ncbi:MAG: zinc ribbon domain-containing protein, partial [Clostridia bacterium]|nr:zinc ribbon domain-containing protein [Clostridia bacterium]